MCSHSLGALLEGSTPTQIAITLNLDDLEWFSLIGMSINGITRIFMGYMWFLCEYTNPRYLIASSWLVVLPWTPRVYGRMFINFPADFPTTQIYINPNDILIFIPQGLGTRPNFGQPNGTWVAWLRLANKFGECTPRLRWHNLGHCLSPPGTILRVNIKECFQWAR